MDGQEKAEGVGDDESIAAFPFLARVEAPGGSRDRVGGADGLRVDQPGARLRVAASASRTLLRSAARRGCARRRRRHATM